MSMLVLAMLRAGKRYSERAPSVCGTVFILDCGPLLHAISGALAIAVDDPDQHRQRVVILYTWRHRASVSAFPVDRCERRHWSAGAGLALMRAFAARWRLSKKSCVLQRPVRLPIRPNVQHPRTRLVGGFTSA
jgi:hypothetical protein